MTTEVLDRSACIEADEHDPLRAVRDAFLLPDDVIYLGGNSLGPLCRPAVAGVNDLVREQWGNGLLASWEEAGWIEAPQRVGDKIARLVGAGPGEVIVTDSTTVNLFKLIVGALPARPGRTVILTEATNFPTDLYVMQGVASLLGPNIEVRALPRAGILTGLDQSVALVALTHVNYQTGERYDMAPMTAAIHDAGALALWDLSHSVGAVPLDLRGSKADLAVGCGYKYLNGGPGAPAFLFVATALQDAIHQPIWGWMGHAEPFAFGASYAPASGTGKYLTGTPHMVAMAALEAAVDLWLTVELDEVWEKSVALSTLFLRLVEERCLPYGVTIASPRDPMARGSHIGLRHAEGYGVMRALIDRGVIGDFRPPDLMRFALTPLFTRYIDVWDAVETVVEVLESRAYDAPAYREQRMVT